MLEFAIHSLQSFPPAGMLLLLYAASILGLVGFYKTLGHVGLYVYVPIAVLVSNLQSLKVVHLFPFSEPVAMGTLTFMTTFLATDVLAEYHGRESAKKAIWSGFIGVLLFIGLMLLTLGVRPLAGENFPQHFQANHRALEILFLPGPALFSASLIAYLVSEFMDVRLYLWIKRLTQGRQLWLRAFLSTAVSGLLDNIVFSVLAWKTFAPTPVETRTLIFTYILGTYFMRLFASLIQVPLLYWVKKRVT